jgi:hypothetical protein
MHMAARPQYEAGQSGQARPGAYDKRRGTFLHKDRTILLDLFRH